MSSYTRRFPFAEDVAAFLRDEAASGRSTAFKVSMTEEPHIDSPEKRDRLTPNIKFLWARLRDNDLFDNGSIDVAWALLPTEEYLRFVDDLRRYPGKGLGHFEDEIDYPTLVPGLVLRLLRWSESWQAFGGGDVGGHDVLWLVNNPVL